MSRGGRFPAALVILAALACPASGAEALKVELIAPWDGATRPGVDSEIGIRVFARSGAKIVFELNAGRTRAEAELSIQTGTIRTLWIPYRPDPDKPATLDLSANGGTRLQLFRRPVLRASVGPVMAIAATTVPLGSRWLPNMPEAAVMAVAPDSLPRTLHAYDQVDVVVIGVSELARLEPRQLVAFQANLGRCGRVVVVGAVRKMATLFGKVAGCGGAFYRTVALGEDAIAVAGALLDRSPVNLPGVEQLRGIGANDGKTPVFTPVILYLLFYMAAIIAACLVSRRAAPVMLVPLAFSVLAILVWYGRAPDSSLAVWSESESGDTTARYVAVLEVAGRGVGAFHLPVPAAAVPTALPAGAVLRVTLDPNGQEKFSIQMGTHLFSRTYIALRAASYVSAAPVIEWQGARPTVRNGGDVASPLLVVGWEGRRFLAPPLAPGTVWRPSESSAVERRGAVDRLFESRMKDRRASFLLPYVPPSLRMDGTVTAARGWRMVISNPGQRGKGQ